MQAITPEQSQEDDGAYAQQHRFVHEHQCMNTELECPAQKETGEGSEINTHPQSQHEEHESVNQTECEP